MFSIVLVDTSHVCDLMVRDRLAYLVIQVLTIQMMTLVFCSVVALEWAVQLPVGTLQLPVAAFVLLVTALGPLVMASGLLVKASRLLAHFRRISSP